MRLTDPTILDTARARAVGTDEHGREMHTHPLIEDAFRCEVTNLLANLISVIDGTFPAEKDGQAPSDRLFPPEGVETAFSTIIKDIYEAGIRQGAAQREIDFGVRNMDTGERASYLVVLSSELPPDVVEALKMDEIHSQEEGLAAVASWVRDHLAHGHEEPVVTGFVMPPEEVVQ